jgi:Cdc6-like AAA superfamily ATPase
MLVDHAGERNFAIVGNRKIGKTSLLNRVEARINVQQRYRLLRLDCQAVRSASDFYALLQSELGAPLHDFSAATLSTILRQEQNRSARSLVLMLDEVDALLALERSDSETLLSALREAANGHICSFIFCGAKLLAQQLRDANSSLFNFPEPIILPYLNRKEIDEIIMRPMEMLGIQLEDSTSVLDSVWVLTSGHPNLTQYIGRALVNAANDRQDRVIRRQDVEGLQTDSIFAQFYFDTIWGATSPLERLITLLVPAAEFTIREVENTLAEAGLEVPPVEVDAALEMLLIYSVLKRTGKKYYLVPQAFHSLLEWNYDRERFIRQETEKYVGGKA